MSTPASDSVWFDARGLQRGYKAHWGRGIGTYVAAMVSALDARAPAERVQMFVERGAELGMSVPPARARLAPGAPRSGGRLAVHVRQHVLLAAWLAAGRPAAVHIAAQTDAPAFVPLPTLITVHDVVLHRRDAAGAYRERPQGRVTAVRFAALRALERLAISRAARLIVPSEVSAAELVATLGIERSRIAVIPEAPADVFRAPAGPADVETRRRLGLPARYLLHVGGADPRKRLPELVEVFDGLAHDHRDLALVLLGPVQRDPAFGPVAHAIARAAAKDRILLPGTLAPADVASVYRGARALVMATRHEGFGLPVVEAFAAGLPVVATAAPAVAEVAGDAGRLVPVEHPELLGDAVREVLDDVSLAETLRERGRARVEAFRWELAAERTLAEYDAVISPRAPRR